MPEAIANRRRGQLMLLFLLLICLAPVVASYVAYYYIHPTARSNYSDLVDPQRPTPALHLRTLDGRPFDVDQFKHIWTLVMTAPGDCLDRCPNELYHMRQIRLTTGKDRDRVQRVWLVTDDTPLSTQIIREYDGTLILRADRAEVDAWLPAANGDRVSDHIFIVDPLGNLMMRFPKDADPNRTKRDLAKLLAASSIG